MTDEQLEKGAKLRERIKTRKERIAAIDEKMAQKDTVTNAHSELRRAMENCLHADLAYSELLLVATLLRGIARGRLTNDEREYEAL